MLASSPCLDQTTCGAARVEDDMPVLITVSSESKLMLALAPVGHNRHTREIDVPKRSQKKKKEFLPCMASSLTLKLKGSSGIVL